MSIKLFHYLALKDLHCEDFHQYLDGNSIFSSQLIRKMIANIMIAIFTNPAIVLYFVVPIFKIQEFD